MSHTIGSPSEKGYKGTEPPSSPPKKAGWGGRIIGGIGTGVWAIGKTFEAIGKVGEAIGDKISAIANPELAAQKESEDYRRSLEEEFSDYPEKKITPLKRELSGTQQKISEAAQPALKIIKTAQSTSEPKTPREKQLENLLRELMSEMTVQARKPFSYAPEHLAYLFTEDVISKVVDQPKAWTERKIVETGGKKSTIFYATDDGKKAVELLDRLGLMKKEASSGGMIYHAQARPTGDQAAKEYITRLLHNWLLEQKGLVIDPEKAEGFLDLSQVEHKLSTYLTKTARADWKPVADELGLPDRDELLSSIVLLARYTALEKAQAHVDELFDNPQDSVQLGKLANNEEVKTTRVGILSRGEEDKEKQAQYYKEQEAQVQKLIERQALIESVLAGDSTSNDTQTIPSAPPPPPH